MDDTYIKAVMDASAPVPMAEALELMGTKRALARVLLCSNQTFTRFRDENGDGCLSPLLSARWRAAVAWAKTRHRAHWKQELAKLGKP